VRPQRRRPGRRCHLGSPDSVGPRCRDGDQYIGGRWNTLSVLYLIFLAAPAAVGLFAYLSYGRLWGVTPGLY
jgi:hypothetical protein